MLFKITSGNFCMIRLVVCNLPCFWRENLKAACTAGIFRYYSLHTAEYYDFLAFWLALFFMRGIKFHNVCRHSSKQKDVFIRKKTSSYSYLKVNETKRLYYLLWICKTKGSQGFIPFKYWLLVVSDFLSRFAIYYLFVYVLFYDHCK